MRIKNISKSTNEESFKYSILISKPYCDISCHLKIITKFKRFKKKKILFIILPINSN